MVNVMTIGQRSPVEHLHLDPERESQEQHELSHGHMWEREFKPEVS